jgi:heat shock protein HtpX
VLHLAAGGETPWNAEIAGIWQSAVPESGPFFSFALVPAAAPTDVLSFSGAGTTSIVEINLPTGQPGAILRCRLQASPHELSRLQRHLHRSVNHRHTEWAIAGMALLLGACGWVIGGAEGARWALLGGTPRADGAGISPEVMRQWFGARRLGPSEFPALFTALHDICWRAGLRRVPDLYCIPAPCSMNAYALGGPDDAVITLTEGLLRGMTFGEIAGILAHEVAHIRNNDVRAMSFAAALQRAISLTSMLALVALQARPGAACGPVAALLANAPAIAQLLCLALSRVRELDADAVALELIDDSWALVAALDKLELHHTGTRVVPMAAHDQDPARFLRSHPATAERVGTLMRLAH